ncbi:MAG: glycoside-pentoside-hexuronide (GPH):cation symporter [Liquorilactobacillus ghanensis]|jgi:GPH family glycoside/pentoside/hexuronide:cation symporter|nr:glycoside-pentoside-hexuronide (GPH):cation symporter [Liquorilactobacillus ghanensis]
MKKADYGEAVNIKAAPFGKRDKIGYMFGDLGNCFILGLVNSFVTIYYTNVLGIAGSTLGTLFLIARFIDAFTDVTIGRLADVAKLTPQGRFRPWIRKAKYPFCIICIVLFLPFVNDFSMIGKLVYVTITYLSYGILLSCINIPYGSLASAISPAPDDKASLSTFRSVGSAIGGATTGLLIPIFMYTSIGSGQKQISGMHFFYISIACAVIAFISYNLTYHFTTERVQVKKTNNVSLKEMFKSISINKPLIALILTDMFVVINQSAFGTMISYLFNDFYKNNVALSISEFFAYGCPIILAPFANKIIKEFGKKEASSVTLLASSVIFFLLYFLKIQNVWLYLALMFLGTVCYSFFNLMVWAFITDVIDYHQYISHYREDGTIYAINSFARKVGQALAGGLSGWLLALIGYQSSTVGGAVQSQAVKDRIYDVANLLPAFLLLVAVLILFFAYSLTKSKMNKISAELKEINKD